MIALVSYQASSSGYRELSKWVGSIPVTKQEIAMRLAARVGLTARVERVWMELSVLIADRAGLAQKA